MPTISVEGYVVDVKVVVTAAFPAVSVTLSGHVRVTVVDLPARWAQLILWWRLKCGKPEGYHKTIKY